MATELRDTLSRIIGKTKVMVDKYHALERAYTAAQEQMTQAQEENVKLRTELERVKRENEYLRIAHAIAPTPEAVDQSKSVLSKMVRDIDRCINQLNA